MGDTAGTGKDCDLCPRCCRVDREAGQFGVCGCPHLPPVAHVSLHDWEEPCISGTRGSGTVFFGGCNLACVFCQNHRISVRPVGRVHTPAELAEVFLAQERRGAHNVNLVSPTPYSKPISEALRLARNRKDGMSGLSLPVVYNSNGYETVEALRRLEGLVDIYLPDLKYRDDSLARRYSNAPGYFEAVTAALAEMARQVGTGAAFDGEGLMTRGLLVRHLVLPGHSDDSRTILTWLARELPGVHLSLMAQYTPVHRVREGGAHGFPDGGSNLARGGRAFPELARRLAPEEYEPLLDLCDELGLDRGYRQSPDAAGEDYIPPFEPQDG